MKQNKIILEFLLKGGKLTALEALQKFGCFRLASRIFDIRKENPKLNIMSKIVTENGKTFARYWIEKDSSPIREAPVPLQKAADKAINDWDNIQKEYIRLSDELTNKEKLKGQTSLWE